MFEVWLTFEARRVIVAYLEAHPECADRPECFTVGGWTNLLRGESSYLGPQEWAHLWDEVFDCDVQAALLSERIIRVKNWTGHKWDDEQWLGPPDRNARKRRPATKPPKTHVPELSGSPPRGRASNS